MTEIGCAALGAKGGRIARRRHVARSRRIQRAECGRLTSVTGEDDLWVDNWLMTAALLGWSHGGIASMFLAHMDGARQGDA